MSHIPSTIAAMTFCSEEEHKNFNAMGLDSSAPSSTVLTHPHDRHRCWGMGPNEVRCHRAGDILIEIQSGSGPIFHYFCSQDHADLEKKATPDILDDQSKVHNPEASLGHLHKKTGGGEGSRTRGEGGPGSERAGRGPHQLPRRRQGTAHRRARRLSAGKE